MSTPPARRKRRSEELAASGWTRQFTASEPRLSEAVRMYEELGFEVRLEPVDPADLPDGACRQCYLVQSDRFKTIYTRPRLPRFP